VLKYLGGGCHLALGALALEREGMILLKAVFVPNQNDRRSLRSAEAMAPTPEDAARLVAAKLLS
jgi:porphobilinogen deaminase